MRTDSARTENSAALPRGGVILTSQLQCLNEAGRLGEAGISSGGCSGGVQPAFTLAWLQGRPEVSVIAFETARKKF